MSPESDDAPQEICGEKSANTFPSEGSSGTVRISFTTTDKTIGAQVRVKFKVKLMYTHAALCIFTRVLKLSGQRFRTLENGLWKILMHDSASLRTTSCARSINIALSISCAATESITVAQEIILTR